MKVSSKCLKVVVVDDVVEIFIELLFLFVVCLYVLNWVHFFFKCWISKKNPK